MYPVDLSNTPGIYYAIAYWLACLVLIHGNELRLRGGRLWFWEGGILVLLGSFMVLTDHPPLYLFPVYVGTEVAILYGFIRIACDIPRRNAVYFMARAFLLGEFAASIEWQLYYYGLTVKGLPRGIWFNLLCLAAVHGVVFLSAHIIERLAEEHNRNLALSSKEVMGAMAIVLVTYVTSNLSYSVKNSPFSTEHMAELYLIRTLVDLGGVGMMTIYHFLLIEMNARMNAQIRQRMLEAQYASYQISKESIAVVNQKYHDLKHQIAYLRSGLSHDERTAYLDKMEQEISAYEAMNKTGNRVLDAILTGKAIKCQNLKIQLITVIDGEALDFMDAMDLSSLFGNSLDNAIESVQKVEDVSQRLIRLKVARVKGFVRIEVENRYEGELKFRNGNPISTKENQAYHGYGVKGIREIAAKYGGSAAISAKNQWFRLSILISEQNKSL